MTSDLIGVGVGTRNLKEIGSDRGAEAYDFIMAAEIKEKEAAERLLQEVLAGAPREAASTREAFHRDHGSHSRAAGKDAPAGAERRTSSMPARRSRSPARDLRYAGRRPQDS